MKKGKFTIVKLLALCLAFSVFSAATLMAADDKPEEIILGGITALSGPAAPWGIGMQNTWQMAVDDIKQRGLVVEKEGHDHQRQKIQFQAQGL